MMELPRSASRLRGSCGSGPAAPPPNSRARRRWRATRCSRASRSDPCRSACSQRQLACVVVAESVRGEVADVGQVRSDRIERPARVERGGAGNRLIRVVGVVEVAAQIADRGSLDDQCPGRDFVLDRQVELLRVRGTEVRSRPRTSRRTGSLARLKSGGDSAGKPSLTRWPTMMSPGEMVTVEPKGSCRNRRRLPPSLPRGIVEDTKAAANDGVRRAAGRRIRSAVRSSCSTASRRHTCRRRSARRCRSCRC